MDAPTTEDGLHLAVDEDLDPERFDQLDEGAPETGTWAEGEADSELESLRAAFVEAFNARDLDEILALVHPRVEVPDVPGADGALVLADEIERIWSNAPAMILTRAFLDGVPCAVAWLPDEEQCWARTALVCFEHERDRLTLVAVPEDPDAMERAEAEAPDDGDELDEWSDWAEWESGEETQLRVRQTL
jgi:hypothetical protein